MFRLEFEFKHIAAQATKFNGKLIIFLKIPFLITLFSFKYCQTREIQFFYEIKN